MEKWYKFSMGFEAFLQHKFDGRRSRNPRYSLRAFARDLGCDHATLSQWLRGVRPMTDASIERIAEKLTLDQTAKALGREFDPLDLTILDLAPDLENPTSPALARQLGVSVDCVNVSLNRLLRLGLLRMDGPSWTVINEDLSL